MKFRAAILPYGSLVLLAAMAASLLSGCGILSPGTPTPLPTIVLGSSNPAPQSSPQGTPQPAASSGGGVTASGVVIAAQEVQIATALGENVEALTVAAGDHVTAGQV